MKPMLALPLCALLFACDDAPKAQVLPAGAAIPAALFVAADFIADAKPVAELKKTAKVGDSVVLRGRIGGNPAPFVDGAAALTLVDVAEPIVCGPTDGCSTKWDYCCTPADELLPSLATLKLMDASGRPVMASLKGVHGLAEFHLLTVRGKVLSVDARNLVVAPEAIYDAGEDGDGKKGGTPVKKMD